MVTVMPFFFPQSFAKPSNQVSNWGTKWLHWMTFNVLVAARAVDTNGAESAGAKPAAPAMALVVFRKCRRVTDPCLFPPYPIAQLLFVMVTMMLLMLTPCLRSTPVRRRATGLTDVTVHAVTVPSRSTGPSALRRKCATQRECRGSVRRTRQSGPTPGPPPLALSRALAAPSRGPQYGVSPIPSAQYGHAPLVWQANSSQRDDCAGQRWSKRRGQTGAARPPISGSPPKRT